MSVRIFIAALIVGAVLATSPGNSYAVPLTFDALGAPRTPGIERGRTLPPPSASEWAIEPSPVETIAADPQLVPASMVLQLTGAEFGEGAPFASVLAFKLDEHLLGMQAPNAAGTLLDGDELSDLDATTLMALVTAIPEPATLLLFGIGALLAARRRC